MSMKKILMVILALFMAFTLVIGSFSMVNATAPPKATIAITNAVETTMYFDVTWDHLQVYKYHYELKKYNNQNLLWETIYTSTDVMCDPPLRTVSLTNQTITDDDITPGTNWYYGKNQYLLYLIACGKNNVPYKNIFPGDYSY
jgi:hypothetical protein